MSNEMNTVNQENTQTPAEQTADGRYKVTKRDLRRTAARYNLGDGSGTSQDLQR